MKSLLLACFVLVSFISYAQIGSIEKLPYQTTVGKIAPMGSFIAELSFTSQGVDSTYTFSFNDMTYTKIDVFKSVSFSSKDNAIDKLYAMFKSVFSEENKKNKEYLVSTILGTKQIYISNHKSMGITQASLLVDNAICYLTEKQIDKLFGKN